MQWMTHRRRVQVGDETWAWRWIRSAAAISRASIPRGGLLFGREQTVNIDFAFCAYVHVPVNDGWDVETECQTSRIINLGSGDLGSTDCCQVDEENSREDTKFAALKRSYRHGSSRRATTSDHLRPYSETNIRRWTLEGGDRQPRCKEVSLTVVLVGTVTQ